MTPEPAIPDRPPQPPRYDVFNGDADGICALHQMRLAEPAEAHLVTGVKRDIALLQRVPSGLPHPPRVLVLDVSLDANAADLRRLLDDGAQVDYFDHHTAAQRFDHPGLRLHWNEAPDMCTSLLVDRYLGGRHRRWAAVAAFGDNLATQGRALGEQCGLAPDAVAVLERLGQVLNYNAYGDCVEALHIAPAALYRALSRYEDPFDFIAGSSHYRDLCDGYDDDCSHLQRLRPYWQKPGGEIYLLPAEPWARRVSGVLANRLAARQAGDAFAILSMHADGTFVVSVRSGAPVERSACGLCEQFAGGGGRRAAAGINQLPAADLPLFIARFSQYFGLESHAG